jgi:hypothetical protein
MSGPAEGAPPPARPPGASRYTWFIGVVAFLFLVLVTINAVDDQGAEPGGPAGGEKLLAFAVPRADAPARQDGNEDANLDSDRACEVRGPGILNICEEWEQGPVVLALFPTDASRCRSVVDQFDRIARRLRDVRFVAVGSRGDRAELRGRRHDFPVGWDRDGGVATAYGLVGCPQITFARKGGAVVETTRQELSDEEIAAKAERLSG